MSTRVLHVISSLERAGAQRQLALLCGALPARGVLRRVIALGAGPVSEDLRRLHVPVEQLHQRSILDLPTARRLRATIQSAKPDLVHAWDPLSLMAVAGSTIGDGAAAPVVATLHRPPTGGRGVSGGGWPMRQLLRLAAKRTEVLVVNTAAVQTFYERLGIPSEAFRVIRCGVSAAPLGGSRNQLRAELGLPPETRLVALVGRLEPDRHVKDAIWATDLLKVIRGDVHLLVVGRGSHMPRLRRFRAQVRVADRVHFLGVRGDASRIAAGCDVVWSTSAVEGQSYAILEAMAAGVPVVAADQASTRELIEHERNGFLVSVGDRAGFARWTNACLNDPDLALRVGEAGRRVVQERFSLDEFADRYVAAYGAALPRG
ncbi:MAG: glycosyltransferase [Planctomycetota bacterium]